MKIVRMVLPETVSLALVVAEGAGSYVMQDRCRGAYHALTLEKYCYLSFEPAGLRKTVWFTFQQMRVRVRLERASVEAEWRVTLAVVTYLLGKKPETIRFDGDKLEYIRQKMYPGWEKPEVNGCVRSSVALKTPA